MISLLKEALPLIFTKSNSNNPIMLYYYFDFYIFLFIYYKFGYIRPVIIRRRSRNAPDGRKDRQTDIKTDRRTLDKIIRTLRLSFHLVCV